MPRASSRSSRTSVDPGGTRRECVEKEFSRRHFWSRAQRVFLHHTSVVSRAMSEYDVHMAETESSSERAGDYTRRFRDRQTLLRQYPGPDAKRFFSWTRGPLAEHLANKEAPKDMPNVVMDLSRPSQACSRRANANGEIA